MALTYFINIDCNIYRHISRSLTHPPQVLPHVQSTANSVSPIYRGSLLVSRSNGTEHKQHNRPSSLTTIEQRRMKRMSIGLMGRKGYVLLETRKSRDRCLTSLSQRPRAQLHFPHAPLCSLCSLPHTPHNSPTLPVRTVPGCCVAQSLRKGRRTKPLRREQRPSTNNRATAQRC